MSTVGKVVHVIAPDLVGGAESVVRVLAAGRRQLGGDTVVIAILGDTGEHPLVASLRQAGVPVRCVEQKGRDYLSQTRHLAALLRAEQPVVVHTHIYHADLVGYGAARAGRYPLVSTVHGITGTGFKNAAYMWLDLFVLRRFDAVVCVSRQLQQRLLGAGFRPERLHCVPNGYGVGVLASREDARAALGLPQEGACAGWVGRLSDEKGPDLFVDAIAALADRDLTGVLVGEGPERERIAGRARQLGLGERVRLAGQRPDAASLLGAFDVLVISSRSEASPMILFEAMAAGVPTVAFAVGGIPEVLDGTSGWPIEPGDAAALAAAIREVLEQPGEAATRAANARRVLEERFGIEQWVRRVEAVYARATERRAKRAR